jgi:hypothetical protein
MIFKKINKLYLTLVITLVGFLQSVSPSFADDGQLTNPVIGDMGNDPDAAKEGSLFIRYAVLMWRAAMSVGGLLVLGFYVMAAFEWISSGDDSSGVEKARNRFLNATIGLILLVSSYAIVGFIGSLFFGDNFNLLEITFPTPN